MTSLTLHTFTRYTGQQRILSASAMRNVACLGRRFGKTHQMTELIVNGKKRGTLGAGKPTAGYAPNAHDWPNLVCRLRSQPDRRRRGGNQRFIIKLASRPC